MSDNVLAVGLFWRNDLGCASVVPSEQTSSSYIILDIYPLDTLALKRLPTATHEQPAETPADRNFESARTPLRTSKSARTVIPTNFYADELIRGEPQIENWKMNYDARVWVRPRTATRVELIRGYTGM